MSRTRNPQSGKPWIRPLTGATFIVLLTATFVTTAGIDRLADKQEERILEGRTGEVAVYLESSMTRIELSFPFMAALLRLAPDPVPAFDAAATQLLSGPIRGLVLAEEVDGQHRAIGLVGEGPTVGTPVGELWEALIARATTEGALVTGVLESGEDGTTVGLAAQAEGTPALLMVLHYDPPNVVQREPGSPFSDIDGAMFVGPDPDPDRLVLTTVDDLPLTGRVARDSITVGADEWLVQTRSDRALVGTLAERTRWGVLAGGLLLSLVTASLVEILARRRAYALRLVEERTVELRAARHAAEEANQSKSEFLSRMSHELRTPLNAVIGFGQLLELETLEPAQQDSVAQILKGGRHLLALINEVLDIARIEAGELALSPEAVHVAELVQEAVDLIQPLADQRNIQVVVDHSGATGSFLFADRQRTKQILLNLLSNAVKYNRARGAVAVACVHEGDNRIRIDVTDTGPGIPEERMADLFTAFERLGAEHTGVEGTGIGLALSQRLAEAMSGRITVESTLGNGSRFSLELPRVENPIDRYERLTRGVAPAADAVERDGRAVVIHIEDNLSNLKLIERIVGERPGVEVVAAMHGRLGLELARERAAALVLLDLHLPDMGGEEVLERLRRDPATASTPVIVVSADATSGQVERLLEAGATAYLTKPIDVRELLRVLDEVLAPASPDPEPPPTDE